MTVKELHVNFDIAAQEVNSNRFDEVTSEEKDILLNNAMFKFINDTLENTTNAVREGYQDTVKRYDELEALYENIELPLYNIDERKQFLFLPPDYLHYDYSESAVFNNCQSTILTEVNEDYWIYTLEFENFDENIAEDLIFEYNSVDYFDVSDYPDIATNIYGNDIKFILIKSIIDSLQYFLKNKDNAVSMYWEKFNGKFYKNSFIFVSKLNNEVFRLKTSNKMITATLQPKLELSKFELPITLWSPNRLIKTSAKHLLNSNFGNTKFSSPIITIENGKLIFHCNSIFKANKVNLGYLRIPKRINLYTNQTCELAEQTHRKIVQSAVQFFKGISNNPEYKNIINENLTI